MLTPIYKTKTDIIKQYYEKQVILRGVTYKRGRVKEGS
jgi:hypothetical protein